MIKYLPCVLGLHTWKQLNPFARMCECCDRLDEIHENLTSTETWFKSHGNEYWLTTRRSIYKRK